MRLLRGLAVVSCVVLGGCDRSSPSSDRGSAALGSANAGDAITLPKLSGKPPRKTSQPPAEAKLQSLSQIEIKPFTRTARVRVPNLHVVHQLTKSPKLEVDVAITPCATPCLPMDVAAWRADEERLRASSVPDLADHPDLTFEIGESNLGGQKVIYIFRFGARAADSDGTGSLAHYINSFVLHFNDGISAARVMASYADAMPPSLEKLRELAPREDLERLAHVFLDAYVQAWAE